MHLNDCLQSRYIFYINSWSALFSLFDYLPVLIEDQSLQINRRIFDKNCHQGGSNKDLQQFIEVKLKFKILFRTFHILKFLTLTVDPRIV